MSLVVSFSVIWALHGYIPQKKREKAFGPSMVILMISALIACQYTLTRNFAVPAWAERELVRARLKETLARDKRIERVVVYLSNKIFAEEGVYEYRFNNLEHPFYAKWAVKNILRELGQDDGIEVTAIEPGMIAPAKLPGSPAPPRVTVVDLRYIGGSQDLANDYRI